MAWIGLMGFKVGWIGLVGGIICGAGPKIEVVWQEWKNKRLLS